MRSLAAVVVGVIFISFHNSHVEGQRNIDPSLQTALETFMDELFPQSNSTALGLAVIRNDGEMLYTNGWGFANVERGERTLNSTQFFIGSTTKSFTSVLAVKVLSERFPALGEAVLDTPIRKLLPELNLTLIDRFRSEQATFRDFLSHKLCIDNSNEMSVTSGQVTSTAELFYRVRYIQETCPFRAAPGLIDSYNNLVIATMGVLIEAVAGKTYQEAMEELWDDLGMISTQFPKVSDDYETMTGRAFPYYMKDGEFYPQNTDLLKRIFVALSSGGIISTPDDMTKYLQLIINMGEVNGVQIVPRDVMMWLKRPGALTGINPHKYKSSNDEIVFNEISYGLGLELVSLDGWEVLQHRGNAPPYSGSMATIPAFKLGVYTVVNTGPPVRFIPTAILVFLYEWIVKGNREGARDVALKTARTVEAGDEKKWRNELERRLAENGKVLTAAQTNCNNEVAELVGKYGSGNLGDIEVVEKLNEKTNEMQYFMQYGTWYHGWLTRIEGVDFEAYAIEWATDVYQDKYAFASLPPGIPIITDTLALLGDTLLFFGQLGVLGMFQRGVSLDTLPVVPWAPDSC